MEEGAISQGIQVPLEAGKGKETDSLLESPERISSSDTLVLAPSDSFHTSGLQSRKRINLGFCKPRGFDNLLEQP